MEAFIVKRCPADPKPKGGEGGAMPWCLVALSYEYLVPRVNQGSFCSEMLPS